MNSCPICKRPSVETFRPFCSKRCADIDLGRWFNESYSIPALPEDDEEKILPPPLDPRNTLE
ncbi:DNA gyrase inhibitor YacG [Asaia krungthepensis]|uniref:DNA gyrase inhibitor YacG n=1 Tax=Asaia krungthepensis NRIC 0535 TaxID=1307925 RepID=A0ABQ0PWN5_9PROT|nr:DNA gyrase inhibitor YacG [Asaia krungthepensis]GBQ83458.1 hypothetical protein AA0535_0255 [Asaia krungthepensis NRIC 0535]